MVVVVVVVVVVVTAAVVVVVLRWLRTYDYSYSYRMYGHNPGLAHTFVAFITWFRVVFYYL